MYSFSENTTSYTSTTAAMIGWRYDDNRQQWYQTSIFWDINSSRAPRKPPRNLMKGFVPGQKCPESVPNGVSSTSSECSSSTDSFYSVFPDSNSSSSVETSQDSVYSGLTYFSCSPHLEVDGVDGQKRERPLSHSRSSLPRLRLTTPEGEESKYIVPTIGPGQEDKRPSTPLVVVGGWPESDTEEVSDIWNFETWGKDVEKLADV